MNTINIKGEPRVKEKSKVKLIFIFHKTGYCRAKKIIQITGLYKDWDHKKQQFKVNSSENEEKNKCLSELKVKYYKVAEQWDQEDREWSPTQWAGCFDIETDEKQEKDRVKSVAQTIDLLVEYFTNKQRIKNGKEISSFSNAREYKFLKSSLVTFTRETYNKQFQTFHYNHITEKFINDYILYLQKRGAKNGNKGAVVQRLKKLKAVVNYAGTKLKIPTANVEIFENFTDKMKQHKFVPKTIPYSAIQRIESLDRSQFSRIENFHIDLFLFSFFAGGMANIDVAYFTWDCIKNNEMIEYERIKTNKDAKVPLLDKTLLIINKYKDMGYENFVFPVFTHKHQTEKQKRERLERLYHKVNKTLEKVRVLIKYNGKITWYSSRGSFITKMINDGYNPAVVAEHSGNSPQIIFKHYYKVLGKAAIRADMNTKF